MGFKGCTEFAAQPVLRSRLPQAPEESHPSPPVLTHRAGSGALAILPVLSPFLSPIRRVWRAVGAVAGRLWVTGESRKTGAGFSSPASCPRGAGGARRGGRRGHSPGPGRGDGGCSPEPGSSREGWAGRVERDGAVEQSKDAN